MAETFSFHMQPWNPAHHLYVLELQRDHVTVCRSMFVVYTTYATMNTLENIWKKKNLTILIAATFSAAHVELSCQSERKRAFSHEGQGEPKLPYIRGALENRGNTSYIMDPESTAHKDAQSP